MSQELLDKNNEFNRWMLITNREGFDGPSDGILFWSILNVADCGFILWWVSVSRDGNHNLYVVSRRTSFELRLGFNHVFHTTMGMPLDHRFNPNQGLHLKDKNHVRIMLRAHRYVNVKSFLGEGQVQEHKISRFYNTSFSKVISEKNISEVFLILEPYEPSYNTFPSL